MPALNFKPQFAPMVRAGIDTEFAKANPGIHPKRQTIRATRKNPIKEGDTLYLYTGMRTKNCEKLGEAICKEVEKIKIWKTQQNIFFVIWIDDELLSTTDKEILAKNDGFESWEELVNFFKTTHGLPFNGQLIKW